MRTAIRKLSVCLLVTALPLSACRDRDGATAGGDSELPDSAKIGGTAVVGSFGDLQGLNSLTATDSYTNAIMRYMLFMPLVKYNEELEPIPWLAEGWELRQIPGDSLELTVRLRKDIQWHDGVPTTAEDVKFTFDRAVDPKTAFANASAFSLYNPESAEVVDPYTFRVRMKPHSDFLDIWYQTAIMPKHLLGDVPPDQLAQHPFQYKPVGNGPFRFVNRVPSQEWVFEANPNFPEDLGGRPYVDRVVWRYIPEQPTLLTELLTGRVDVYPGANATQAARIKADPNVELKTAPTPQWVYITYNTNLPMFDTAEERRALTMALDRQAIVDGLVYGYGEVGRGTATPAHWSYEPDDPQTFVPYDTAQARRLLAQAGWEDRDGDGILENEQGKEFRFTLKTNKGNDLRKDIMEVVQAQLRPLGIVVEPKLVEWVTLLDQLQGSLNARGEREREFEAVVSSWVDYFRKDDADILHSRNINNPYQFAEYTNPTVDRYLDTLAVITEREQARPLWRDYERLIVQESPYTVIYYPERLTGVHKRLQNVETDVRGELVNVQDWWIVPSQRRGGAGKTPAAQTDTAAPAAQ